VVPGPAPPPAITATRGRIDPALQAQQGPLEGHILAGVVRTKHQHPEQFARAGSARLWPAAPAAGNPTGLAPGSAATTAPGEEEATGQVASRTWAGSIHHESWRHQKTSSSLPPTWFHVHHRTAPAAPPPRRPGRRRRAGLCPARRGRPEMFSKARGSGRWGKTAQPDRIGPGEAGAQHVLLHPESSQIVRADSPSAGRGRSHGKAGRLGQPAEITRSSKDVVSWAEAHCGPTNPPDARLHQGHRVVQGPAGVRRARGSATPTNRPRSRGSFAGGMARRTSACWRSRAGRNSRSRGDRPQSESSGWTTRSAPAARPGGWLEQQRPHCLPDSPPQTDQAG